MARQIKQYLEEIGAQAGITPDELWGNENTKPPRRSMTCLELLVRLVLKAETNPDVREAVLADYRHFRARMATMPAPPPQERHQILDDIMRAVPGVKVPQ